eukprot:2433633-Pleurochrysis_carterae.AAC.1
MSPPYQLRQLDEPEGDDPAARAVAGQDVCHPEELSEGHHRVGHVDSCRGRLCRAPAPAPQRAVVGARARLSRRRPAASQQLDRRLQVQVQRQHRLH